MWGTLLFTTAVLIMLFGNIPTAGTVLSNIGWVAMTTGFQFVLYSRLHLVNPGKKFLRIALIFIVVDAIIFHGIVVISVIISSVKPTMTTWQVFEAASFTEIAFTVQETVLTTLYVYYFIQYTLESRAESATKTTLWLLIAAEVVVFSTDITLNVLLYTKFYLPRAMIQPFCSALKLKIEFIVLNSLVDYSKSKARSAALPSWVSGEGAVKAHVSPIMPSPSSKGSDVHDAIDLCPEER
jgi:hypothetical protein